MYTKNLRDGALIIREGAPLWEAGKSYGLGDYVRPATRNGFIYECTRAGTSGATAPTWPTTVDGTVDDPDGSGAEWTAVTPESLEVQFIENGTLSWEETHAYAVMKDRGKIKGRRPGDEEECQLSFGLQYTVFQSEATDASPSPVDCFKAAGAAASWNSSRPSHEPHAVDVIAKILHSDKSKYEVILFPDVAASKVSFQEGEEGNSLTVEGGALAIEPTITWEDVS